MEPAEDLSVSLAPPPVFVDDTGRRHALIRRIGQLLVVGFAAYISLLVVGLARDPRVGPVHLPTFGLPSLGLATPPAPTVLGQQASRAATGSEVVTAGRATPAGTNSQPGSGHDPTSSKTSTPTTNPASPPSLSTTATTSAAPTTPTTTSTTTAPTIPGHGPKSSTTTSTTAPSSTSSTPTTSTTTPSTNSGQGLGASSGKGPDGTGAPGQLRRTTPMPTG